jgi:protocatechuate 3,4-dioxygenase beta subunit
MGRLVAVLVVGILGATAAACWWLQADEVPVATGGAAETPSTEPVPPADFVRAEGLEVLDAGVGRVEGVVRFEDGKPVVGAEVVIYAEPAPTEGLECGLCHEHVLDCADPATARQVLAGLRDGSLRRAGPAVKTVTDQQGAFVFEAAPLDRELLVITPRGTAAGTTASDAPLELVIMTFAEEEEAPLSVTDPHGTPVVGARVTVFQPETGAVSEHVTDAEGEVKLPPGLEYAWYGVEAPGCLPAGGRNRTVVVSPPMALTVRTTVGGKPVDADLTLDLHRPASALRTKDGVLRLEGLSYGTLRLSASTAQLASAEVVVELLQPETEVRLELLAGAKLFVTVVTEAGEPLAAVSADLLGVAQASNASASAEQGAPLVFGPLPEGEYRLTVFAEGFVRGTRAVDLKPGENSLELTLRAEEKLTGRVVDAKGAGVGLARVEVFDGEVALSTAYADDDGAYSVSVEQPGRYRLIAEQSLVGKGEATSAAPGTPTTIVLQPGAAVEAEVFDVDGAPLEADLVLRQELSMVGVLEQIPGTRVVRRAGLAPGKYLLTLSEDGRLPIKQALELRSDETRRLTIRLQEGATVRGRVVNTEGQPVAEVNVFATDLDGSATTGDDGHFEFKGLPPGPVELYGFTRTGAPVAEVKVTAPARDVVLTVKQGRRVKGRAVDEHGAPLAGVRVDEQVVTGADGRFAAEVQEEGDLELSLDGYQLRVLEKPAGDLGDVVLRRTPTIEGTVVDAEGRPVSGASVRAGLSESTASDAAGRFSLPVPGEAPTEVFASRGPLFGRAAVAAGAPVRLVLGAGTKVNGRVLGPEGGRHTTVDLSSLGGLYPSDEVETDGQGRFTLVLPEGLWSFSPRSDRSARTVDVRGATLEVVLGDGPRDCGLVVTAPEAIVSFMLVPPGSDTRNPVAGSIDFPGRQHDTTLTARAVPCGDYVAEVLLRSGLLRQPVSVHEKAQPLRLDLSFLQGDEPVLVLP